MRTAPDLFTHGAVPLEDYRPFRQGEFIRRKTPWAHRDPKQRQGARQEGRGHARGACFGLSMLYAKCGDFDAFERMLGTPDGLAIVRGMQNLSAVVARDNPNAEGFLDEVMRVHGFHSASDVVHFRDARYEQRPLFPLLAAPLADHTQRIAADLVRVLDAGRGMVFVSVTFGSRQTHAAIAHRAGPNYTLFDANCGLATVAPQRRSIFFTTWIRHQFSSPWSWMIERFQPRA